MRSVAVQMLEFFRIKSAVRNAVDYFILFFGLILFAFTKKTPESAYQALIRLYCVNSCGMNAVLSKLFSLISPAYSLTSTSGILGTLSQDSIANITKELDEKGYYIFPQKLSEEACDAILKFATTTETLCRLDDKEGVAPKSRAIYDRSHTRSSLYVFTSDDLMKAPIIQDLVADYSLLAVAQAYLRSRPIIDIVGMWWSTAFTTKALKTSAQYYHFDMDRVKWLKYFIYITDVEPENGPHVFIEGTHRDGAIPPELSKQGYARLTDEEVESRYPKELVISMTGKRGTIIAEDTRGMHKGKNLTSGDRLVFNLEYTNSLFGTKITEIQCPPTKTPALQKMIRELPGVFSVFKL